MKRLVLASPADSVEGCKLTVEEVPVPQPGPNQVLVKMTAAPVNPSDYLDWLKTGDEFESDEKPEFPMALGIEGCGVVVQSGGGLLNWGFSVGTKVGVVGLKDKQGTYSEYVVVSTILGEGCFALPPNLEPLADAASFFVNPYTACGLIDTVRSKHGQNAFVHTAAASHLGQMMVQLAVKQGDMDIICVVRREEQAESLKKLGAKHVLVTGSAKDDMEWMKQLRSKMQDLNTTVVLDAVGGKMTGQLIDVMPATPEKAAHIYVYGSLAGRCSHIDSAKLRYGNKYMHGWLLPNWLKGDGMIRAYFKLTNATQLVHEGLENKEKGWCQSQFVDTTMETMHEELLKILKEGVTGKKLRIRMDN